MTRFEEYQLLYYQKELENKQKMIEELVFENMMLTRANVKLGMENSRLRAKVCSRDFSRNGIVCISELL
ncbi:hypothetical protein [Clostridium folliculivorans]|uniref:Uncharacterized protein n=1 Tax=Clostridium folliculivorans TaxID=2886038 RepID=A0A9W5XZZ9_9CLOT|nr:hypothetical protein [Clostridium folliculivorans]GKU24055.1 hypothetical protein CFOLD11_08810 [Clostridium folliculivorans]GKU30168.1 hypothetical protein CFB3_22750 [Clostridium folliculivorans]